jgi:prepilin-type N-terminal cleavage/methylation domain-containing protein
VVRARQAFTLIELVVTVAVLALLTVLGAVGLNSILDRSDAGLAQARLETVRVVQTKFASTYGNFTPNPADLGATAPNDASSGVFRMPALSLFIQAVPLNPESGGFEAESVSIAVSDEGALGLATLTPSGRCLGLLVAEVSAPSVSVELPSDSVCEGRSVLPAGEYPLDASLSSRW